MLSAYRFVLEAHVTFGMLALAAFWIAVLARKGGSTHLHAGRSYVATMSATAATAVALGAMTLADTLGTHPPEAGSNAAAIAEHVRFVRILIPSIGFTGLIALALVHFGWRAPARGRRRGRVGRALDTGAPAALLAIGVAGIPLGRVPGYEFADGMGVACVAFAVPLLAAVVRSRAGRPWIVAHLAGLGGAAVIGHGAFFVSVIPRVAPEIWSRDPTENPIPWVVPPLVGVVLLAWACLHWRARLVPRQRLAVP